jgi:hypothetical protein
MSAPKPDPRIAAYVAEVSAPGIPWISTSHVTLRRLWDEHGKATVQGLLQAYWVALGEFKMREEEAQPYEHYVARRKAYGFSYLPQAEWQANQPL